MPVRPGARAREKHTLTRKFCSSRWRLISGGSGRFRFTSSWSSAISKMERHVVLCDPYMDPYYTMWQFGTCVSAYICFGSWTFSMPLSCLPLIWHAYIFYISIMLFVMIILTSIMRKSSRWNLQIKKWTFNGKLRWKFQMFAACRWNSSLWIF